MKKYSQTAQSSEVPAKIKPGMNHLVWMYKESFGGYYSDTVFERRKIFVRREDRVCFISYSPVSSEIE